jgi:hypothetical protein
MKLTVITTARTFEFVLSNTVSVNKVNLEIIDDLENKKLPYITFDYPFYYSQSISSKHPIPINKQHLVTWYITEA